MLVLIGIKMAIVTPIFGYHFPAGVWFAIIATCLGASIALSAIYKPPPEIEQIHPPEAETGDPV